MTPIPVKQPTPRRSADRRSRGLRDQHRMEQRRMRAADLLERGVIPAEIARQVGVAHQVVSEWRKTWRQGGREALRSAGPAGRKSKLTDAQFTEVRSALINGAGATGARRMCGPCRGWPRSSSTSRAFRITPVMFG